MRRTFFIVFCLLSAMLWQTVPALGAAGPEHVLVRFQEPTGLTRARALLDSPDFAVDEALVPALDIFLVRIKSTVTVSAAVRQLKAHPRVRWAQADHPLELRSVPDDFQFASQWSLNQASDADIDAPEAWDLTTGGSSAGGSEIVVAVVDNGCLLTHLDLAENIWINTGEIPGNALDDDANGYVDDVNGWDAYQNDGTIPVSNSPYHGTHVAGIVGARANNGRQIAGVNWHVKLMIVAASDNRTAVVARGYNYVLAQKIRWWESGGLAGANVVATNSSFGINYGDCSADSFPIWNDLYNALGGEGILSACATANLNINVDVNGDIPTTCTSPYIIAVTNTNSNDARASAGYGPISIDLGAPGSAILSTVNTGTGYLSGTSMATPHVTGAIALMHAAASPDFYQYYIAYPDSAALLLKQLLLESVDPLPGFDTLTVSGGRLNLFQAASAAQNFVGAEPAVPFLVITGQAIEDAVTGNENGALEAAETARLELTLTNYGAAATNVAGSIATTDLYLVIMDGSVFYGDIAADGTASNSADPFGIAADPATPFGHTAVLTLTLTADSGYTVTLPFMVTVGKDTIYWSDNIESGENGWTHGTVLPAYNDAWHISTELYASPGHAWKCGDTNSGSYPNYLDAGLTTPPITILPHSRLTFSHWLDSELSNLYPDSAFDGGVIEVSADGGAFLPVSPVGGYPKAFRTNRGVVSFSGPMPGRPCFAGVIPWVQRTVDLAEYEGQTIQIRFRFGSDSASTREGWYLDDLAIHGQAPDPLPPEAVDDLIILPLGDDIQLAWTAAVGANRYVVYRSLDPVFIPSALDSIAGTTDTTYIDPGILLIEPRAFYAVKARH